MSLSPELTAPLASAVVAAQGLDWESLGLVLSILGCFLLANGVLLRDPRSLLAQRLARATPHLRTLRELVFQRVQTGLGLVFLTGGFAVQLIGRALPEKEGPDLPGSIALWVGVLVVVGIALEVLGWWWSLFSFRRQVGAFLRADPPDLSADMPLARELGELFGVHAHETDTVQSYLERVRTALGLPVPARGSRRAATRGADEPLEGAEPFAAGESRAATVRPRPAAPPLELPRSP
jgi:hypothetical protein